jgi:NAD-dependent dihydropyrimidine dehydrogenase PreA subunit
MTYVITEPCIGVKDRACVDVCPVDCIYEGEDQLYINADECIDCGACEPECPVTAIFPEEDVPPQYTEFIEKNKVIFEGDNPPGRPDR